VYPAAAAHTAGAPIPPFHLQRLEPTVHPAHPSTRPAAVSSSSHRARAFATIVATGALGVLALSLGACENPTATPAEPTALPATAEPPTDVPPPTAIVTPTATLTPTAVAAPTLPPPPPVVPTTAAVAQPTVAAPVVAPTTAPVPTANSGLPVIEFYPDNGQANLGKDQLCTAVNWRTENVTDVRLQIGGGPATSVAASGRQGDICFGEDKLKIRLIYKHTDGREESREIDLTREDD
jgi:hypothetical protein